MIDQIYKRVGATIDFSFYGPQCFICGNPECKNHHYDNIESCGRYAPIKPFDEWYTELQAVIYHSETPYANEDGSVDEGTDATIEIYDAIKRDDMVFMPMIESWAKGDLPYKCFEDMLEDMRP